MTKSTAVRRRKTTTATTALVAGLSLMLPSLAQMASAQAEVAAPESGGAGEVGRGVDGGLAGVPAGVLGLADNSGITDLMLCAELTLPPCAEGDPMPVAIADIPSKRLQELRTEVEARDDLTIEDLIPPAGAAPSGVEAPAEGTTAATEQAEADAAAAALAAEADTPQVTDQTAGDKSEDAVATEADAEVRQNLEAGVVAQEPAGPLLPIVSEETAAPTQAAQTEPAPAAETAPVSEPAAELAAEPVPQQSVDPSPAVTADVTADVTTDQTVDLTVDPTVDTSAPSMSAAAANDATNSASSEIVEETISAENSRSSDEEFSTAVTESEVTANAATAETTATAAPSETDNGLSTFEKALLLGIGAIAVGSILKNGDQVVANTGDRVVVQSDTGLTIYKDDDALLRQPGGTIRTETFADGSTRSVLQREDGTQVITIRDANGRVQRRVRVLDDGTQVELFDDLTQAEPVDIIELRRAEPQAATVTLSSSDRAMLAAALAAGPTYQSGRTYSLRQIREISEVRYLVPGIDLDTLTFATGSAAIRPDQSESLVRLGLLMERALDDNPREVFLIEGHTDAIGSDSLNLALSDRRAETVALALTEVFDIPPENLVVQGYGESFLKIQTQRAEEANRRATIRRITPLLRQVAKN